ncbi:hypothetical protein [uncultured Zobellia sp.]|uniref:hypothetical protein n=1 Tax=uncultured Zobellia sp. TaxID=255433 RepID=UPI00259565FD|nr:hypothetical protein [uncultured Zobellia sp.]
MKTTNIKLILLTCMATIIFSCEDEVTDFGFNGAITGMVSDNDGTALFGDLNSNNLVVYLLGEGDEQPTQIRVNGEGSYQNSKMYPKAHKVWLEGPIVASDTVSVDFSSQEIVEKSFTVTPLISPKISLATAQGQAISVDYDILSNQGNTITKMEIYCSTVKYPTAATGSRTNIYFTKTVELEQLSGTVLIDGLESGEEYYLRIGAQAETASVMNYSNQMTVTIN